MSSEVKACLRAEDFVHQTDAYRRELLAHCYRMLGSADEAEDLVQETYLRAWRSRGTFEGRSSLRTWLYRIATTACLSALERRGRRPLPSGLGGPSADPEGNLGLEPGLAWLQPMPDVLVGGAVAGSAAAGDPAAVATARASMRLAFVAALQYLPPRQRAVLILRDVLAWPAAEVADLLNSTTAAVNSALQRARVQLREAAPSEDAVVEPTDPEQRKLLDRYVTAFETADMAALEHLLKEDAAWEMPPFRAWFTGRSAIIRLILAQCPAGPGDLRLVPVHANGQPAFALYLRGEDGVRHAFSVQVLTLAGGRVSRVVSFMEPRLVGRFGLPPRL